MLINYCFTFLQCRHNYHNILCVAPSWPSMPCGWVNMQNMSLTLAQMEISISATISCCVGVALWGFKIPFCFPHGKDDIEKKKKWRLYVLFFVAQTYHHWNTVSILWQSFGCKVINISGTNTLLFIIYNLVIWSHYKYWFHSGTALCLVQLQRLCGLMLFRSHIFRKHKLLEGFTGCIKQSRRLSKIFSDSVR